MSATMRAAVVTRFGEHLDLRDVPVPVPKHGQVLVRVRACGVCHGADLKGLGAVPPLAGRSPSYTVRQLFDLQRLANDGFQLTQCAVLSVLGFEFFSQGQAQARLGFQHIGACAFTTF